MLIERSNGNVVIYGGDTKKAIVKHLDFLRQCDRRLIWIGKTSEIPDHICRLAVRPYINRTEDEISIYRDNTLKQLGWSYTLNKNITDITVAVSSYVNSREGESKWIAIRGLKCTSYVFSFLKRSDF